MQAWTRRRAKTLGRKSGDEFGRLLEDLWVGPSGPTISCVGKGPLGPAASGAKARKFRAVNVGTEAPTHKPAELFCRQVWDRGPSRSCNRDAGKSLSRGSWPG